MTGTQLEREREREREEAKHKVDECVTTEDEHSVSYSLSHKY